MDALTVKDVKAMTVKLLKTELGARGLDQSGKKADLAARLVAFVEQAAAKAATAAHGTEQRAEKRARSPDAEPVPSGKKVAEETPVEAAAPAAVQKRAVKRERSPEPEETAADVASSVSQKRTAREETRVAGPVAVKPEPDAAPATAVAVKEEPESEDEVYQEELEDRTHNCPYLDTINRVVLDFDFEKLCSVNLSNQNVYACLVCGKYFQGRGKETNAYTHSVQAFHHVFLNLRTLRFYCLPDGYEVMDASLEDIKFVLKPTFSKEMIRAVDNATKMARAYDGTMYFPGIMGLNNIKFNDYVNVAMQVLIRVKPLRDFFLADPLGDCQDPLLTAVGELVRKIHNPRAFKCHVSPHELLQAVSTASKKRFRIMEQSDPMDFISWLLSTLNRKLQRRKVSVVADTFEGKLAITSRKVPPTPDQAEIAGITVDPTAEEYQPVEQSTPFMVLPLDMPPPPLFQDEGLVPQVPLFGLFNKYDGSTEKEYKTYKDTIMKTFQLKHLPDYLILHIKRFTKNNFFVEKNPTIVNFPVKNVDLTDYLDQPSLDPASYSYDLVGNIVHDGPPGVGKGTYRAHVQNKGSKQWFEMQDLHVTDILPEMITLSESYIQVWERQKP